MCGNNNNNLRIGLLSAQGVVLVVLVSVFNSLVALPYFTGSIL